MNVKLGFLFAIGLAMAGCAPEAKSPSEASLTPPPETVPPPDFESIALMPNTPKLLNDGRDIHVGQEVSDAEGYLTRPSRAVKFRDLPPGFGKGFRSEGWEFDGEGLGIISYNGKVVAAVHTETGVDARRVEAVLSRYRTSTELKPDVVGTSARYWFDSRGGVQRMLCAVVAKDGFDLTEAVGTDKSMKALRMNPLQAQNDVAKADKRPQEANKPTS